MGCRPSRGRVLLLLLVSAWGMWSASQSEAVEDRPQSALAGGRREGGVKETCAEDRQPPAPSLLSFFFLRLFFMSADLASLRAYVTDDAGRAGFNQAASTVRLNVEHASLKARFAELRLDKHVRKKKKKKREGSFFFLFFFLECPPHPPHAARPTCLCSTGWLRPGGAARVVRWRGRG